MNTFVKTILIAFVLCSPLAHASKFNVKFVDATQKLGVSTDPKLCFGIFPPNSTIASGDTPLDGVALFHDACFGAGKGTCKRIPHTASIFTDIWFRSQARVAIYPASKTERGLACQPVSRDSRVVSELIDVPDHGASYNLTCTYSGQEATDWNHRANGKLECVRN